MSRLEKNRHHLATAISLLAGIPVLLICEIARPDLLPFWMATGLLIAAIFLLRTVLIEMNIRRKLTTGERKLEDSARKTLRKQFGISIE